MPFVVVDGTPEQFDAVREGYLTVSMVQPVPALAEAAVGWLVMTMKGEIIKEGPTDRGTTVTNVDGTLRELILPVLATLENVDDPTLWANNQKQIRATVARAKKDMHETDHLLRLGYISRHGSVSPSVAGFSIPTENPATGVIFGELHEATPEEIDEVVTGAQSVFRTTWRHVAPDERGRLLRDGRHRSPPIATTVIRVNSVCPGMVDTAMADGHRADVSNYALGRIASPDWNARVILFLTSEDSSFVTGFALAADGGRIFF